MNLTLKPRRAVRPALLWLTAAAVLTGCAVTPTTPTVIVLPGSQKTPSQFQTDAAAWVLLPAASRAVTTSSTSPASASGASHSSRPRLSALPLHTLPSSFTSVLLS